MKLIKRVCAYICVVALLAAVLCVTAAETDTPAKQAAQTESSAFIDLQLENISAESGRAAAQDMLLGTVSSLSGGSEARVVERAGAAAPELSFSWTSTASFLLVLTVFSLIGWFFLRLRRRNAN